MPKVAIVIPNWNGEDFIVDCLESLLAQSLEAEIIVVDNGSHDRSVDIIKDKFPGVTLLEFSNNAGFAGGVNRGIKYSIENTFEFVALFNNDAVADKDWIKNLVTTMESNQKTGIVTGKFMKSDKKTIDSTGEMMRINGMPHPRGRDELDAGQYNVGEQVFAATGGASLYRAKMLEHIGLFDEKFFAYLEDVDISFRAQLASWKVLYEPTAVSYHKGGATSSKLGTFTRFHTTKNFHLLFLKNMPGLLFWKYFPLAIAHSLRLAAGAAVHKQYWTHLKAYFAAVTLIPHCLRERNQIQKNRKVSIKYIDSILTHKINPSPKKVKN